MAVDIDSLQIEIEATSSDAASKIEQLATALTNLKSAAKGGAGLTTTTKQLQALSNAAKLINGTNLNSQKIQQFASAMNSLSTIQKASGLNSTINALKKLPDIRTALDKADLGKFAQQMNQVASAMRPLATEMQKVANGFSAFPIRIQKIIQSNSALTASNNKTAKSFGVLGTGISSAQAKFGVYLIAFRQLASVMSDWVKESNDYVENLNLFTVAMGDYAAEAKAYAEEVQAAMGIDPSEWMRNQGVFMQMAAGFGVATDSAALMSKNLTQLGYDISSFYNISIEDAMQKLQSGLAGEIEPLRRLGYAIDVASLEQVALNHGITESVNAMSQAEKSQLRYIAIMEQSSNAMGDLSRTIQTPANAMRILNQQIVQLQRALGNMLIPILQKVIPWVQAFVEVLTEAAQAIANFLGFELPTIDYSGLEGISSGASDASDALGEAADAAKKLQHYTLGIDELNIISPDQAASGGAGGVPGGDLGLELPEYDFLGDLTKQTDEIKKRLEPILKTALAIGAAFLAWKIGNAIINGLSFLLQNLKTISGTLGFVIGLATFLYNVFDALANGLDMSNLIGMIAGVGVAMGALVLMGRTLVAGLVGIAGGITIVAISIKDAIENGLNETNLSGIVAGITVSILGLYLAFGRVGAIIGAVIGGITLLTTGFNDFIDNGKTDYNIRAIAEGFMLLGVGISLINPKIGLVIIGVGILVTAFLEFGDEAVGVLNVVWAAIKNTGGVLGNLAVTAGATFDNILKFAGNSAVGIKNSFFALIENLKAAFNNGWINIQSGFLGFYKTILSGIVSIAEKINSLTSIFGIEIDVSGINAEIQEIADTQKELDESKREYSDIGEAFSEGMGTFQYNDLSAAMSTFETFSDGWINQAYEDGKAVGTALQNGFRDMLASAKDQMSGMVSGLFGGEDSADSLVDEYKQSFSEISFSMGSSYNLMEEYNKSLSSAAGQDFSAMSDSFIGNTDIMRAQSGLLKDTALTDIETTKTTMESSLAESLDTNQRFTASVESMYKTMASRSNSAIQSIISSLNSIPRNITTVHTIITKSISGGSSSKAYASGGFPETGQMFIARERGPELVGTIGNRTAVANNAQIVQGIASGVADANREQNTLLREQNELLRAILAKEGTVKIGNKAIKKAYDTASRQSGASIMPGGVMT